eukprot:scaffold47360_cov68-Phaeocystis_antarctica.AAC.2
MATSLNKISDPSPASISSVSAMSGCPVISATASTSATSESESGLGTLPLELAAAVSTWTVPKLAVDPALKKRRSAALIPPSSSGTACPPSCHSVVMFSQREGTLHSCAGLIIVSALPSTCNDGVAID